MGNKIKLLDQDVVHKIAAGEVIVSPTNALKELIENSLDAGSSSIQVVCKDGGFKLLQITDNGNGIDDDDLPLLCQRFATSKISAFEDLETVSTLGFRGEALCSISHVAHLSVKTKVSTSSTATVATFGDSKLLSTKKCAGVQGTQVSVEDMFYNIPLRLKALRSKSNSDGAEYQKILDVVTKYAIMYPGTFSCKRVQDSQPFVIPAGPPKEKMKRIFGAGVFKNLLDLNIELADGEPGSEFGLKAVSGCITSLNYPSKKSTPYIFFINKRLVSCDPLSRAIRKVYQDHMPKSSSHAVVFLSIELKSENIDVNVHPTKREVRFLYEDEIVDIISQKITKELTKSSDSRDYSVQSYIPATNLPSPLQVTLESSAKPKYEYNMVRTDPMQSRVTHYTNNYIPRTSNKDASAIAPPKNKNRDLPGVLDSIKQADDRGTSDISATHSDDESDNETTRISRKSIGNKDVSNATSFSNRNQITVRDLNLSSVHELILDIRRNASSRLFHLFSKHSFVGVIDSKRRLAAVQQDVRLYLIEYKLAFREFFYQLALTSVGNFGTVHLGDGIPIEQFSNFNSFHMTEMLLDYFRIEFKRREDGWYLTQMPLILPGYVFSISKLKNFLVDIGNIDFSNEKECMRMLALALADVNIPSQKESRSIETVFIAMKTCFVPSKSLLSSVIEIASLPKLYKVFERC